MQYGNPKYPYHYKHLVIVHGIGDQVPNETSLNFMNQLLRALPNGQGFTLQVDNLIESVDDVKTQAPGKPDRTYRPAFAVFVSDAAQCNFVIGFSEVYWQHITNGYLQKFQGSPPVPIFVWAHSINTRFLREGWQFHTAREAIDNLEKLLGLTQKLALIYKKADVLARVLHRFLGDVQMYAESDAIREEINQRFCSVLERVPAFAAEKMSLFQGARFQPEEPEIYVVAHSEGTVVSYNSLVEAAGRGDDWLKYLSFAQINDNELRPKQGEEPRG
jgi:hypothetical protein